MKRILIITYYWPPSGGAGVQRWLKFTKYLRDFGWEPVIYTPQNPESPAQDNTLLDDVPEGIEVLKTPINEPYTVYKRFVGRKKSDRIKTGFLTEKKVPSLTEKISVWIRGNLFIPDARKFWIKPSVKYLHDYLKKNPVDVIISTGPPHSMHLIANKLNEKLGISWLADFRDPWTSIDFYKDLMISERADNKHHKLEKKVLKNANRVVVVSNGMAQDFNKIYSKTYDIITNGYDHQDDDQEEVELDRSFSISHIGSMVKTRNPEIFWQALKELVDENADFMKSLEIKLIGQVDFSVDQMIEKYGLADHLSKTEYLSHNEVIKVQRSSQILLLLINDTPNSRLVLTGKLFEYLNSKRPILCIGPTDGDAAKVLSETGAGKTVGYNDKEGLKSLVLSHFELFQQGKLDVSGSNIEIYSRKNLTKKMAEILNEM